MKNKEGKHLFGVVKVGEKGQIVIPSEARKIFKIQSGDSLVVLGDESQGLALIKSEEMLKFANSVFKENSEVNHDSN